VRQLFGGSQHIVLDVERRAHGQPDFDSNLASTHQVASGLPVPAAELLEVIGIGGAGKAGEAALLAAPQTALQLLQEREIVARRPGKGGKIEAQPANTTPASLTTSGSCATTQGAEACRNQGEKGRSSERRSLLCNI
jgi:hypothetical protein